jgi:hypothetical protein
LTTRALETVEASKATTSARDARHIDVVETPQDAGKEEEEEVLLELQAEREETQKQPQ